MATMIVMATARVLFTRGVVSGVLVVRGGRLVSGVCGVVVLWRGRLVSEVAWVSVGSHLGFDVCLPVEIAHPATAA